MLRVTSEIGRLSSVLVHLPGPEIDRMIPAMMEELLFDDILYGAARARSTAASSRFWGSSRRRSWTRRRSWRRCSP